MFAGRVRRARFGILRGHWRLQTDREHPGEDIPDGHVFTQRWPAGPSSQRRDQVIYYTYKADRARRYRTIQIQAGPHVITAADSLPSELQQALDQINRRSAVHWIPLWHAHILQAGQGALIGAIFDQ